MAGATNTIIQILRSTTTAYPTSLNPGEQAYSYVSNKLFVGNTDNSVITIGGKYYVDLIDGATSANTGNTIVRRDDSGNAAFKMVSVSDSASQTTDVVNKGYLDTRISALSSNTIYDGTVGSTGYSNVHTSNVDAGGSVIIIANNSTVASFTKTAATFAEDVLVSGNLVVKGATSYTNVTTLLVDNNSIVMNANAAGRPLVNAYLTVNRGSADNAAVIWNESAGKWQLDKGINANYDIIDTGGGQSINGTTTLNAASVTNGLHAGSLEVSGAVNVSTLTANTTIYTNQLVVASNVQLSNVANVSLFTSVIDTSVYPTTPQRHYILVADTVTGNNQVQANSYVYFDASNTTFGVGYTAYTPLPNTMYQGTGSSSTYVQNNLQNLNNNGSADQVITADNGSDSLGFIDVGMAGGNYNYLTYAGETGPFKPNDGWIQVVGSTGIGRGNLIIGTGTANTDTSMHIGAIKFTLGNQAYANIIGFLSRENDSPTGNATWAIGKTSGANYAHALDVVGSANVGSLFINNTKILGSNFGLPTSYGGTGQTSFTANSVIYGNGTGALLSSNAPTTGQILQYRTDGVKFGGLDGGTF